MLSSLLLLSAATFNQFSLNAPSPQPPRYALHAEAAFHTLQKTYNTTTGLYSTTGWWNAANCITTIGSLAYFDPRVTGEIQVVLENTYIEAPKMNIGISKRIQPNTYMIETNWKTSERRVWDSKGFLNGYYDDEGWWALAWIQAYDLTRNEKYLQTAIDIFEDMKNGTATPCGGIWWDKSNTYVAAIANELYLSVATHLSNRAVLKQDKYLNIALKQWKWFQQSGLINTNNTINDGLTKGCKSNYGTVWSYNQGVILSALVELSIATHDPIYANTASKIANAAIKALSDKEGILHDPCEPNCGADGSQFKGIFMRGLIKLWQVKREKVFELFIAGNADIIWERNRNDDNELGVVWSGPVQQINAGTQSSALDALVAGVGLRI